MALRPRLTAGLPFLRLVPLLTLSASSLPAPPLSRTEEIIGECRGLRAGVDHYDGVMALLDEAEGRRWLAAAREHLRAGRHARAGGFHAHAVLAAEQAAQCALKAMLRATGSVDSARGHSLPELLSAAARRSGFVVDERLADRLGELSAHYQPTRYPDALASGTPGDHYGTEAAERFLSAAGEIIDAAAKHLDRLRVAAQEDGDDTHAG